MMIPPSQMCLPSPSANLFERSMNALVSNFKGSMAAAAAAAASQGTFDWGIEEDPASFLGSNWDPTQGFEEGGGKEGLDELFDQDLLGLFAASANLQQKGGDLTGDNNNNNLPNLSPSTEALFTLDNGQYLLTPGGSLRTDSFLGAPSATHLSSSSPAQLDQDQITDYDAAFTNYQAPTPFSSTAGAAGTAASPGNALPSSASSAMLAPLPNSLDVDEFKNPAFDYIVGSFLDTIESMAPATNFDLDAFADIGKTYTNSMGSLDPNALGSSGAGLGSYGDGKGLEFHEDMLLLDFDDFASSLALKNQTTSAAVAQFDDSLSGLNNLAASAGLNAESRYGGAGGGVSMGNVYAPPPQQTSPQNTTAYGLSPNAQITNASPAAMQQQQQRQYQQQQGMMLAPSRAASRRGPGAGADASRYSPRPPTNSQSSYQQQQQQQLLQHPPQSQHRMGKQTSDPSQFLNNQGGLDIYNGTPPAQKFQPPQQQQQQNMGRPYQQPPPRPVVQSAGAAASVYRPAHTQLFPCPSANCSKVFSKYTSLTQHLATQHGVTQMPQAPPVAPQGLSHHHPHHPQQSQPQSHIYNPNHPQPQQHLNHPPGPLYHTPQSHYISHPTSTSPAATTQSQTNTSKAKPYHCTLCPQTFSRSHDLKRHYYVHTQEKPYRCKRCQKGFSRRDALKRHEKSVAEGKKVHCRAADGSVIGGPWADDEDEDEEEEWEGKRRTSGLSGGAASEFGGSPMPQHVIQQQQQQQQQQRPQSAPEGVGHAGQQQQPDPLYQQLRQQQHAARERMESGGSGGSGGGAQ